MARGNAPARDKRSAAATRPTTTEWRHRSYLRVRRPAWANAPAVAAKKS